MRDKRRARRKKEMRKGVEMAEKRRAYGVTPLYDDGRRYNAYQCSPRGGCGGIYLTVDLDKGTTPMFMRCYVTPGCGGMASSLGYPKSPPPRKLPLMIEWYEPAEDATLPANLEEHVRMGGLLKRPGPDVKEWHFQQGLFHPVVPRRGETNTQLELILGENNGESTAQESSDHVHLAGSESSSGEGADPGPAGQGEALEEVRGPEQDPR